MKIIYGVAGTGKSEYIFDEIKKSDANKIYIITPEQFSFTAEKKLLDKLDNGATLNCEVLSFERMAYRVINACIPNKLNNLGKSGKAEIIFDAISKNQKSLKFLGKSQENVDTIITQITEFKKHNITVQMLENKKDETKNEYLKAKLNDMLIMYKALENKIPDNFLDENDVLTILAENIEKSHLFDNAVFYIDEFAGFTKQEYAVISKLDKIAKEVYITVCTDELKITKPPELDIFYDNKQTIQSLCQISDIDKENQVKLTQKYRFKNSELNHLEENLFAIPYKVYQDELKNIKLYLGDNKYDEVENVATNIVKLVRDENYRYKDIAVICKNIDDYSSLCKAIFGEYEIPVFIDIKKDITQNLIIKYVLSILDIFIKNWSYEAVFNYIKTGFVNIENVYELENYCLKWGIKGKRWFEEHWSYEQNKSVNNNMSNNNLINGNVTNNNLANDSLVNNSIVNDSLVNNNLISDNLANDRLLNDNIGNANQVDDVNFNKEQEMIVKPLLELKESLKGTKTAKQISVNLFDFLEKQIDKESLEEEQLEALQIIYDVLGEITYIFGDENITFDHYSKILKIGLSSKELGQIPQTQDKVTVGDVNRSRTHKVKAVFIIGVNDGVFPSTMQSEGFFDDRDRENLKEEGFELAKGSKEKLYEENFNIYRAFTTAEKKLFISYASSDIDGKALRKSLMISKLKRIFPKLIENSSLQDEVLTKNITFSKLLNNLENENWNEVYEWYKENYPEKLEAAIMGLKFSNVPEVLDKEKIAKLYGENLKTSVSKLETYRACAFSYFLKYGLKLSDKEKLDVKPVDTGTFMHNIIDEFFRSTTDVKNISEEQIQQILDKIIDEELQHGGKFMLTAKYRILVKRLKKVIFMSLKYIIESLKDSSFDVLGTELNFGRGETPPIEIKLDDGRKVLIEGKIDRVDIAKMPDGKYIRIIDYKSSSKDINLNKVIAGLQLQLITYVDAICSEDEELQPAGALYFTLLEPKILGSVKNLKKEEIEKLIKENYKMKGLILADVNIVKAMDNNLTTGKSNVIPVTLNNSGEINYSKSNTVTRDEFEKSQKYTQKIIKQISKEILDGRIDLKPYYDLKEKNTPCMYCEYKSICQFNPKFKGNDYKYIGTKSRQEILDEL